VSAQVTTPTTGQPQHQDRRLPTAEEAAVQAVAAGVAVVAAAAVAAAVAVAALGAGWERAAVEIVAQATGGWAQIAD
jgi:hypothetical protein